MNIPAGSCTWTAGVTVPGTIGISIIGAGQGSTTITDHLTSGSLFSMTPTYGNSLSRISSMTLLPYLPRSGYGTPITVNGTCTSSGCPNLRLDHLTAPSSWAAIGIADDTFAIVGNMFGVADHNTIGDVQPGSNGVDFINVSYGSWKGVGQYGDNSWASADTFGTEQAFYIENNTLNYALITDSDTGGPAGGGARFVCRFNQVNSISSGGGCTGHGTDTTGRPRGARQVEAYYNTGTCTNASQGYGSFTVGRSATSRVFSNTITNSGGGFFKGMANLDTQRRWRPDSPWGACAGTASWDTNAGIVYYSGTISGVSGGSPWVITDSGANWTTSQWVSNGTPYSLLASNGAAFEIGANGTNTLTATFSCPSSSCAGSTDPSVGTTYQILRSTACIDQPARGAGLLLSGTSPTPVQSVNQALSPIYEAADSLPGTADHTINSNTLSIIANRDFYVESVNQAAQTSATSPFNGSSGTGHGTLARRPTTCTTGVGYWATDQGNWNQSVSGGQGVLYICTASGWPSSPSYTPYTYPHPLAQ